MRSAVYQWKGSGGNTALIAADQALTQNIPMILQSSGQMNYQGNPFLVFEMPAQTTRFLTITSASDLSAINFTVLQQDEWGNFSSFIMAGPNADTVSSPQSLKILMSVTPSATSADQASLSYSDGGFTIPFVCDVWNKEALYSYQIANLQGNATITPQITLAPVPQFGVQSQEAQYPQETDWENLTALVNMNALEDLNSMPISALRFNITATQDNTSFKLMILQQGGFF